MPETHVIRDAQSALSRGDLPRALAAFESALSSDPRSLSAAWGRAVVLEKMGDHERAREAAEACLSIRLGYEPAFDMLDRLQAQEKSGELLRGALRSPEDREASHANWEPGDVLLERYEVRAVLGQGAMGVVHRVHHRDWAVDLAVKSPLPDPNGHVVPGHLAALRSEAENWVALALHPHVVTCHYVALISGVPRIFMECIEGRSLWEMIADDSLYETGSRDAFARIIDVGIQAAWGLGHAHSSRGVALVHQDVKPQNLLVDAGDVVRVTDFGLARAETGRRIGVTVRGRTPSYASPEQLQAWLARRPQASAHEVERIGPASDIWSLGVTLLHALLGGSAAPCPVGAAAHRVLAERASPGASTRAGTIPAELYAVLERCLNVDSSARPSADELAAELTALHETVGRAAYAREQPRMRTMLAADLSNRAMSLMDLARPQEARLAMNRAVAADPTDIFIRYNDALLGWRSGEVTDRHASRQLDSVLHGAGSPDSSGWSNALSTLGLLQALLAAEAGHGGAVERLSAAAEHPWLSAATSRARAHLTSPAAFSIPAGLVGQEGLHIVGAVDRTRSAPDPLTLVIGTAGHEFTVHGYRKMHTVSFQNRTTGARGTLEARLLRATGGLMMGDDGVVDVAVSADGTLAASGALDGAVRVWDLNAASSVATLLAEEEVRAVAMTPRGRWILALYEHQMARLWCLRDRRVMRTLEGVIGVALVALDDRELQVGMVVTTTWGREVSVVPGPAAPFYIARPTALEIERSLRVDSTVWTEAVAESVGPEAAHVAAIHAQERSFSRTFDEPDKAVIVSLYEMESLDERGREREARARTLWEFTSSATPAERERILDELIRAGRQRKDVGDWAGLRKTALLIRELPGLAFHSVALEFLAESVLHMGRGNCLGHHPLWRVRAHESAVIGLGPLIDGVVPSVAEDGSLRMTEARAGTPRATLQLEPACYASFAHRSERCYVRPSRCRRPSWPEGEYYDILRLPHFDTCGELPYSVESVLLLQGTGCIESSYEGVRYGSGTLTKAPKGSTLLATTADGRVTLLSENGGVGILRADGEYRRLHDGIAATSGVLGPGGAYAIWTPTSMRSKTLRPGDTEPAWSYSGIGVAGVRSRPPVLPPLADENTLALALDSLLIVGTAYGAVHAVDVQRGVSIGLLGAHQACVTRVMASPDARFVASADAHGYLSAYELVWDAAVDGQHPSNDRLSDLQDEYMSTLPGDEFSPQELLDFLATAGCGDRSMGEVAEAAARAASLRKRSRGGSE